MRSVRRFLALAAGAALALSGCASSMSGDVYSRDQARKVQRVDEGEIIMVREVMIEGTKSGLGVVAGGVVGGVLGSMVGGGKGQTLGTVAGAVGGAGAGAAAEEAATRQKGLEITVKLENGEVVSVVQAADREYLVGDEVKVLRNPDGTARVIQ
jgi:outer membrane lipoprotein SlyB